MERTDIELVFANPEDALRARRIAEAMITVFYLNGREWLPFDDMKKENADGWLHYPGRYVGYENVSSFKILWHYYQDEYRRARTGARVHVQDEQAKKILRQMRRDGSRLIIEDCDYIDIERMIENQYFEDFFSMLCFLMAARFPDAAFEGMRRASIRGYAKRLLTHAVYDGKKLTFEQMEGDPVYATIIVSWTRVEGMFVKSSMRFPFIRVELITEDHEGVEQDKEIEEWIRCVNDVKMEMVSAQLRFMHASYPSIMIDASSREICEKYWGSLLELLTEKGYRTETFSILYGGECPDSSVVIRSSVTTIGSKAFRDRTDLQSIVIPDSVTEISDNAFDACSSLEEVRIPDSVKKIDDFAFSGCSGLTSITLPRKLSKISTGMLGSCRKLESIAIPDRVKLIERFAFARCGSLKSVVIPEKVREIQDEAFKECTGLKTIVIPARTVKIGKNVFRDCSPDLVIRGEEGSEAERYAAENGIKFEIWEENDRIGEGNLPC